MAEIVRGGIISVDKGQLEGAYSVGMTHGQAMRKVVIPQYKHIRTLTHQLVLQCLPFVSGQSKGIGVLPAYKGGMGIIAELRAYSVI